MRNFFFGLLAFFVFCSTSTAQSGEVVGQHCGGIPVIVDASARALAEAQGETMEHGLQTVVHPALLNNPALARGIMAHECGHHRLGHVGSRLAAPVIGLRSIAARLKEAKHEELDADCWGKKDLQAKGDKEAVTAFLQWLRRSGFKEGDTHPSSHARLAHLNACAN